MSTRSETTFQQANFCHTATNNIFGDTRLAMRVRLNGCPPPAQSLAGTSAGERTPAVVVFKDPAVDRMLRLQREIEEMAAELEALRGMDKRAARRRAVQILTGR